jgi:hypothetical protein
MVFDDVRNSFYADAIAQAVTPESIVLDLGAGLGIHGFMAARQGARQVYMVEPASIIDITRQLVDANELSDRVKCIRGTIEEIDLPEPVDIIISVFTGNFLLTEDLLPSLFYARDRYLKPGGSLIPDRAAMEVVPISAPEYHAEHIDCWLNDATVIDFSLIRNFATNSLYHDYPGNRDSEFLAEPGELLDLDFMTATQAACRDRTEVVATRDGTCHGWLGWFRIRLGEQWLSTSPQQAQTHWRQVFLPLAEPFSVREGDILSFELNRPEFGEWTWTSTHNGKKQRHSTFQSNPGSHVNMLQRADTYSAHLSEKGKAARDVLSRLDGDLQTSAIAEYLVNRYEKLFHDQEQAARFVKELIARYGK